MLAEERSRQSECKREGDEADAGAPCRKRGDERDCDVAQGIELATDATAKLNQGLDAHDQKGAQLECRLLVGAVPMRVPGTVTEGSGPAGEPSQMPPSEGSPSRNEEARQQEGCEQERRGQSPRRPRRAPDAKRCLNQGCHT